MVRAEGGGARSLWAAWVPLGALALAFFVEMVDNTVLTIALPTIGRDLSAGPAQLQWISAAYPLTFGSLLLAGGALADRLGRRRVLVGSLALFGGLSLAVAGVTSAGQLIALRAGLGVAASGMGPVTLSLVFRLFDAQALRMRAMNLMVGIGMCAMALGPVLAGTALAAVPWRWLVLVNAPIAVCAALGVWLGVPADSPADLRAEPVDLAGALATMAVIGVGSYAFTSASTRGWRATATLCWAAAAAVCLAVLWWRERSATNPLLDPRILSLPTVRGSALAQIGSQLAVSGALFGLVLHFQYAYGWSPLHAGLANLPFVITTLLASPLAVQLAGRLGHRGACVVGTVLQVSSTVGLGWVVPHGYWAIVAPLVGLTTGMRIIMTVCSVALVEAMPPDRTSLATALNDTAQVLGTSIGTAVVGTVLAGALGRGLTSTPWDPAMVRMFFTAERHAYLASAAIVGLVCGHGCRTLTRSRATNE